MSIRKINAVLLGIISICALAACGSSGGGNGDSRPSYTSQNTTPYQPNTKDSWEKKPLNVDKRNHSVFGAYYAAGSTTPTPTSSEGTTHLTIGDKTFNLRIASIHNHVDCFKTNACSNAIQLEDNISYGFINSSNTTGNHIVFAQGKPTPIDQIPTQGQAIYHGKSFIYNHQTNKQQSNLKSDFLADFNFKLLEGHISSILPNEANRHLNAKISGNKFQGDNDRFHTEGGFYGSNAQNIAGVFHDKQSKEVGAFGAQLQSKSE